MIQDQIQIIVVLLITVILFLWGRWRHDAVALFSLLACVFLGLIPSQQAFTGFGHPAVITVACVLVLSWGLQSTGAVNVLAKHILPKSAGLTLSIAILIVFGVFLSAFMNNIGAMALLMPIALQLAAKHEIPPGKILMPLAFGTILGGMTTLIGTPPNLIVSGFRLESAGNSFGMFDFSPVGVVIAAAGVIFVTLLGWRIVPARKQGDGESFDTGTYLTEARITEKSKVDGSTLREVEKKIEEIDAQIIGMIRNDFRISAPGPQRLLRANDVLVIEAEPEALESVLSSLGLELEEAVEPDPESENDDN
ncbi:MAG: SLC13 family permease, partial [Gammaproteobacteria bacterium]